MWEAGRRTAARARQDALGTARGGPVSGGMMATIISAAALLFSSYSFYESVLRAPQIAVFVPPQIGYTDPDQPTSPFEVFVLPLTLANDGARSGTVLSIDLDVTNPRTGKTKKFYAARMGAWGSTPLRPFAPVALSGKASFSQALQFFPRFGEKIERILGLEAGSYTFRLKLNTAAAGGDTFFVERGDEQTIRFEMQINQLNYFNFNNNGTMTMWTPDYKPSVSK